jgi:hypothetical protein
MTRLVICRIIDFTKILKLAVSDNLFVGLINIVFTVWNIDILKVEFAIPSEIDICIVKLDG